MFNIFAQIRKLKFRSIILILILLILGMFILNLQMGNASVSLIDVFDSEIARQLIVNHRLPKTIAAILAGIALPISGLLLQELFRNPLADPSVLGITSASGLGVAVVLFLASSFGLTYLFHNPWLLCMASISGAILGLLTIVYFSSKLNSNSGLIIVGMMIAGFSSAIIGVMQFFAPSEKIKSYLMWTFGSITGLSWTQLAVFAFMVILGIGISVLSFKAIAGLRLGEDYAHSMGIDVKKNRWLILLSSAILTASATAFVGPIAFIGLAIPHICRILFKRTQIIELYSLVVGIGILSMLIFSWISQIFPNENLPINILTSLIGAPIVMRILLNSKHFSI